MYIWLADVTPLAGFMLSQVACGSWVGYADLFLMALACEPNEAQDSILFSCVYLEVSGCLLDGNLNTCHAYSHFCADRKKLSILLSSLFVHIGSVLTS